MLKKFLNDNRGSSSVSCIFVVVALVVAAILLGTTIRTVPAGHVGVIHTFGDVQSTERNPGLLIKAPWQGLEKFETRTQEYTMTWTATEGARRGDDSIAVLTAEGLRVGIDVTIRFHIKPEMASDIYRSLGHNYEGRILRPEMRGIVRDIVAQYNASDVYSEKRADIVDEMMDEFEGVVDERGIVVENLILRNVRLPDKLMNAIEAKLEAEQQAQQMDFEIQREAKEKERKRIEAEAIAQANDIIAQSLTDNYLKWYWLDTMEENDNTVYIVPSEMPFPFVKNIDN